MAGFKQLFVGRPLETDRIEEEKLSKKAALAVFSSDALSSTAYATEEILLALLAAGAASFAVYVNLNDAEPERMESQWEKWVEDIPLIVLNSPYRSILRPLLYFIEEVQAFHQEGMVTVLLPEFVPASWWERLLHNQHGLILRSALAFKPNVVVTSVRRHLRN